MATSGANGLLKAPSTTSLVSKTTLTAQVAEWIELVRDLALEQHSSEETWQ